MKQIVKTIIVITFFSIAMGYLESAIVVYLRDLYYPNGFKFPMNTIHHQNAVTEFWREIATIIMLWSAGYLAGKNRAERFAYFIYSFAVWDLFYYVFLKAILNWPESFFTWDILFLIPVPWIGPVLAPCLVCLCMITLSWMMIYFNAKGLKANLKGRERMLIISGCLIIVASFVKDYLVTIYAHNNFNIWTPLSRDMLFEDFMTFVPQVYAWWMFFTGACCLIGAVSLYYIRLRKQLAPQITSGEVEFSYAPNQYSHES
jgi:hypothetical protein